jgi:hypothetical protein
LKENVLTQRALWNALRSLFPVDMAASIELRFQSEAGTSLIHSDLIIHCLDPLADGQLEGLRRAVERLLPGEYGWSHRAESDETAGGPWIIQRLVRRLDFFDLPTPQALWSLNGDKGGKTSGAAGAKQSGISEGLAGGANPFQIFAQLDLTRRKLPDLNSDNPFNEFQYGVPLCVPILGEIENESPDVKRLLLDLLNCAPAIVSITLHFGPDLMPTRQEQLVATRLKLILEPFAHSVAGAGYASVQGLRKIYDRYSLPAHRLCNLSIRVAAEKKQLVRGLSHNLASQFGGLKVLELLRDEQVDDLGAIWRTEGEVGDTGRKGRWAEALEQKLIESANWDDEEDKAAYTSMLMRLPSLYTMDEATELLRLPCATEGGLPGIATRVIPPFYSSSPEPVPYQALPEGRLRVGIIRSSSLGQQEALPTGSVNTDEPRWEKSFWHTLRVNDLCKHALIVGSTGSGKTQTTLFLMTELARNNLPFLVIEPVKTEYLADLRPWVEKIRRYRLELTREDMSRDEEGKARYNYSQYLRFDPMRIMPGVTPARHISYLKSCFEAAFPMELVFSMILESGIRAYYTLPVESGGCGFHQFQSDCGVSVREGTERVIPSFLDFRKYFVDQYLDIAFPKQGGGGEAEDDGEWRFNLRQMFVRRFDSLSGGPFGAACAQADKDFLRLWAKYKKLLPEREGKGADFAGALQRKMNGSFRTQPFLRLLKGPTVVELDGISDNEQKALVMAFLLTFLYEYRQANKGTASAERPHVVVIEEAHRLLARDAMGATTGGDNMGLSSRGKAVGLFVDMLAEIRALGQSLFIVEQIPMKLVAEAIKNTNLKIMLRLTSADDRDFLGEAMNFNDDQKRFVSTLRPLQLVVFEENLDQPVLLSIPHCSQWSGLGIAHKIN